MRSLEIEVESLNSRYCHNTKNHLVIRNYFGNVQVALTGKNSTEGLKDRYFGITNGFSDPVIALKNLQQCDKYGWLLAVIMRYEKRTKK